MYSIHFRRSVRVLTSLIPRLHDQANVKQLLSECI